MWCGSVVCFVGHEREEGLGEGMYFLQPVGQACLQNLLTFLSYSRKNEEDKEDTLPGDMQASGPVPHQSPGKAKMKFIHNALFAELHVIKYYYFLFMWLTMFLFPDIISVSSLLILLFAFS